MGISRKMKDKNWTDSQGRKGKGYGVYRFADKYGVSRKEFFFFFPSSFFSPLALFFSFPVFFFFGHRSSRHSLLTRPPTENAPLPPPHNPGQRRRLLPDLHPGHLVRVGRLLQARHQGPRRVGGPDRRAARRRRQPDHLDQPAGLLDLTIPVGYFSPFFFSCFALCPR